jgi:release factor glutamine methyltransferase
MSYVRHATLDPYLAKVRQHTEPYESEIFGRDILIYPGVMSPKYDRSAQMFISMMPKQKGKSFLEIGSGTGIVALFAGLQGARSLVCTDINSVAVQNSQANLTKHGFSNAIILHGDLFEGVIGRFDSIFFNLPFHGSKALDMLELGTCDEDYATLKRFMAEVGNYMHDDGRLYVGFADSGDNELLKAEVEKNGLKILELQTMLNGDWSAHLYTIVRSKSATMQP